jgi:hypothetical protein
MTWLYPAEIVPLKIRAPTNALATSGNWIFNFMVSSNHSLISFNQLLTTAGGHDYSGGL